MTDVHLVGRLICADARQASIVAEHLPAHLALTRAEPGCLSFEVTPTSGPLIWSVEEHFDGEPSFRAHQSRAASSPWGRATAHLTRDYTITGLPADD
ncbi:antibiotic biosynthesis monooxygenase [Herbiconiux sp. VKM Ac-1786]|uniref:putative quinol monooxygenase n=1 Tax=Herbiconiux sp. VKM Ac-1786 TaxID=2783824 RepID=UPI00188B6C84|nr:antibiotic biosynthesis monooxygenase family protein [Herbiconiux sp. VKM Ac-1786]MBF4571581.1 antibiotic biosynthesis monooxygenase [Herbiconiux sp. VKM Ac-1786]